MAAPKPAGRRVGHPRSLQATLRTTDSEDARPVIDLHPAVARLSTLIEAVPDSALGGPTPCSEYSVGDLLDHIAGITVAFGGAAAKSRGESADMGPQGDVTNLDANWRISLPTRLETLGRSWKDPDAWSGMTRVGGQDIPAEVAGIVSYGELAVHGWDLSRATRLPFEPDPLGVSALFDLVRQTFASTQGGPPSPAFGPPVPVAEDAPMFDQTLGMLGRDPNWSP
jgi:uncharacterized protein (TIGR03086 family)